MKKNTKKKLFTLMLVIMLLAITVVGGSLAWFTDSDKTTNTFTVGSIEIVQLEQQHNDAGELEDFKQNKILMPIVNTEAPADDRNYEEKIVTVKNTGKNPAFVRTLIAYPIELFPDYLHLDIGTNSGWQYEGFYQTTEYAVYYYYHTAALNAQDVTLPLLNGIYLDSQTDIKFNIDTQQMEFCKWNSTFNAFDFSGFAVTDGVTIDVHVLTQAVQAEGFDNFPEDALNAAFGTPDVDNNPFASE